MTRALNLLEETFNPLSSHRRPYFCQLTGLESESSYNDTLALFHEQLSGSDKGLIFNHGLSQPHDGFLIDPLMQKLSSMRIGDYVHEAINPTSSNSLTLKIREVLDKLTKLALSKEHFPDETPLHGLIAQLIVWCNLYVDGLNFNDAVRPKCLFYGPTTRYEAYFLMLLAQIGVDVFYFNPTNDTTLNEIDENNLCETIVLGAPCSVFIPYEACIKNAACIKGTTCTQNAAYLPKEIIIEKVTTYAKQATDELEQILYQDTGIYKPWQFSNGTTRPIFMESVIEDTLTYWNEPAKLRPGFKTTDKIVHTPIFFTKINGVYKDVNNYYTLVQTLKSAKNFIFYESPHLASVGFGQSQAIRYHNIPASYTRPLSNFNPKDLDGLASCLNADYTIQRDRVRQHALYQKMKTLRSDVQEFILSKLEETFLLDSLNFFCFPLTDEKKAQLMATIFTAEERLLHLIEGYDFTSDIPKIILYINSKELFYEEDALLLGLLHRMGLDVLLLSPNGASTIEQMISSSFINDIKLDVFVQDLPLKIPTKKRSFFSKLFK